MVENKRQNKKRIGLIAGIVFLLLWVIVGSAFFGGWAANYLAKPETKLVDGAGFDGNMTVSKDEADVASLVNKVSPSVVSIVTKHASSNRYYSYDTEGGGTGIIISKDGYILTNKHVIRGVKSVQIVMSDGARHDKVDIVGSDPLNDLAFLKIKDVDNLPAATLGDSGTARVGQRVIAIGNSLGQYQNTVTSGIISGLGRPIQAALDDSGRDVESLTDLLQTDAAINPGNSGGPLINMSGQVIGINTAIVSDAQSMGFAIPINASKGLIRGILKDGAIKKSYLGVQYIAITPDVRAEFNLTEKQGALIKTDSKQSAVVSGGPADRAGVREGDIIVQINDKKVGERGGLGSIVSEYLPGETIKLTVIRDSKPVEIQLTLDSYEP